MISRIDLKHINKMGIINYEIKNIRYKKSPIDGVICDIIIKSSHNFITTISVADFVNNHLKPYLNSLGMVITMNDNLKYNIKLKDNEIVYKSSINRDNDTYGVKEKALIRLAVKALELH